MGISIALEAKLKRLCDLFSQKTQRAVSMEEALETLTDSYLEKNDPIKKAERNLCPDRIKTPKPGRATSAQVIHAVNLRDQTQCVFRYSDGTRCEERRWTDRHHVKEVANGGLSTVENLATLCSGHHKYLHSRVLR